MGKIIDYSVLIKILLIKFHKSGLTEKEIKIYNGLARWNNNQFPNNPICHI
jgi:hypothetical protein